jgi:hypothetical protein
MFKTWVGILAALALTAACAPFQQPDPQAVRIEGTPGMAVIYIVRTRPDISYVPAQIALDGNLLGTTHAGTYFRLEVPAGRHRISGYGVDAGDITLNTQAGQIYFIRQSVAGSWRSPTSLSSFYTVIDEARARAAMAGAEKAG